MTDNYLFNKQGKKIYCLKQPLDLKLLVDVFKQNGFELIYLQNIKELFAAHTEKDLNQKNETPFSKNMELFSENIYSTRFKDFFNNLQFSIKPFISILNSMNLNFCLCDEEHYILCNRRFLDTIQYNRDELKEMTWNEIVFERDRKRLKDKLEQFKIQDLRNHEFDMDVNIITRNKEFKLLKFFIYKINIESKIFLVNYIFNKEHFQDHSSSVWFMNKLIINELNNIFINQIRINSLNISLNDKHESKSIDGRSVSLDGSVSIDITSREIEIIKLIYKGHSNQEIAEKLYISPRTVEYHRSNLLKKTYSKNIVDLIRFSLENGLISTKQN